jgi:hypothetical protein
MRFDHQKAFPYPVLRPDIDDYIDGAFQVTVDVESEGDRITARTKVALSVPEIKKEIEAGRARISIIFSCRDTYFRHSVITSKYDFANTFENGVLRGEVIIYPFVVATKPIGRFSCRDINKEFGKGSFSFTAGEVLAADVPKVVYIDRELFKPISSILQLLKDDNLSGFEWKMRFSENKLQVHLSAEAKQMIDKARNTKSGRAILINSLYFAAIMEAIQRLRDDEGEYADLKWAKILQQQCHNFGIDIKANDSYFTAQKLLRTPLALLHANTFKGEEP